MESRVNPAAPAQSTVKVIARPQHDQLGEGVCWSPRLGAVLWVDIIGKGLFRYDVASQHVDHWPLPEATGWIIERRRRDDFIIGMKSGFARLSLDPFQIEHIVSPEPDRPGNRLNDAKVDPAGRIWAGTMDASEATVCGALYRLDPDFNCSRHDDGYTVTNRPTFSADGHTLYHTDSVRRIVSAFDLSADGTLSNKRTFLTFTDDQGYPDGMTTDAEGGIWIAHWAGGRVSRFLSDGTLDRSIALPASQITNCAFGGPNLDRLFVTSAAKGLDDEPLAGSLFEVDPGVRGLPPIPFAG
ncbi:SMP-30/gluconolactonase/LRE family protein [Novosphingobium sp. BL-52-GroH]|uniref:SMP-30/gluconolactonase/LRE family protein n=1 Tax=Novosphingobium sp. BL-52-GroH TaxID=3349877 RepID=UPI00384B2618